MPLTTPIQGAPVALVQLAREAGAATSDAAKLALDLERFWRHMRDLHRPQRERDALNTALQAMLDARRAIGELEGLLLDSLDGAVLAPAEGTIR
jgi:hypothetical protein